MKKNQILLLICSFCHVFLFSCNNIKTTKINIAEEGVTLTSRVLKDSLIIEDSDTVRILHGKFKYKEDYSSIDAVFDKGFINGLYKEKQDNKIYKGKFISKGAELFQQQNGSGIGMIPSNFHFSDFTILYKADDFFLTALYKESNYFRGYIGIPIGKHILMRNDSIVAEMEFDQGVPIGKWKKESGIDQYDFIEFESGNIFKEYTLQYNDGEIIKRIEGDREFIYENGVEIATIFQLKFDCGGIKLSVPFDKMWTPLFYKVKTDSYYYKRPKIYPKKVSRGTGWLNSESYDFPKKDDFQSYKISKQNNKAIYGDGDQAVLVGCRGENAFYTAYFLEESK